MRLDESSELKQALHDYVQSLHEALLRAQGETQQSRRLAVSANP